MPVTPPATPVKPPATPVKPVRRIGLNVPVMRGARLRDLEPLRRAEALGFTDLWSQETDAHDAFTPLAVAAACTTGMRLGTAIASIFTRSPALLAMQAASLAEAAPGRFVLGLGTSSPPIVEGWNGLRFEQPLLRMRRTLDDLETIFGSGRSGAFQLGIAVPEPPPIHVAALGPKMSLLAAERAQGVILSLVGPAHARRLVERYRANEPVAGQGEVVLRIGCLLGRDRAAAAHHARRTLAAYLAVPAYAALYRELGEAGRVERIGELWRAGSHQAARAAVPDEWVEGVFAIGSAEEIAERVARFRDAGIDTPILAPTVFDADLGRALEVWAGA